MRPVTPRPASGWSTSETTTVGPLRPWRQRVDVVPPRRPRDRRRRSPAGGAGRAARPVTRERPARFPGSRGGKDRPMGARGTAMTGVLTVARRRATASASFALAPSLLPGGRGRRAGPARPRPRLAGLGPAGPLLPGRHRQARRLRDLEQPLVRRSPHARLRRPVPAARGGVRHLDRRRPQRRRLGVPGRPAAPPGHRPPLPPGVDVVRRQHRDQHRGRPAAVRPRPRRRPRRASSPPNAGGSSSRRAHARHRRRQPGRQRLPRPRVPGLGLVVGRVAPRAASSASRPRRSPRCC